MATMVSGGSDVWRQLYRDYSQEYGTINPNMALSSTARRGIEAGNKSIHDKAKKSADLKFQQIIKEIEGKLTSAIDSYSSSRQMSDQERAAYYSKLLSKLYDPNKRDETIKEYFSGNIPGITGGSTLNVKTSRYGNMPPAWS